MPSAQAVSSTPPFFVSGATYIFSQTEDSLTVSLQVPDDFDPKKRQRDVIEINENTLLVKVHGEDSPRLSGWLFHPINKHDSVYDLQRDSKTNFRILTLNLTKSQNDSFLPMPKYPILFSSGFNTPAPMPKNAPLDDLDPHSLYLLADWMLQRLRKAHRAFEWYEKAAERGSIMACLKLGAWFEVGKEVMPEIPVARDRRKAFEYHKKAADMGHPEACMLVSEWYAPMNKDFVKDLLQEQGKQVDDSQKHEKNEEDDFVESVKYCEKVCQIVAQHNAAQIPAFRELQAVAMWRAGVLYAEGGHGLPESTEGITKAFECFRTAALEYGHIRSLWSVALYYLNGFGTPQDVLKGVELLKKALAADPNLKMPPQLEGLEGIGLDILVGVEKEARKVQGVAADKTLDVDGLVQAAKQIVEKAGGATHVEDTVEQALKELELSVVKVAPLEAGGEVATNGSTKVNVEEAVRGDGRQGKNGRRKRRGSKVKGRKSKQAWIGVDVAIGVGVVAAVGFGVWMWMRGSRSKA